MKKRVVITGIGPVTAIGIGSEQFQKGLFAGRSVARQIPKRFCEAYKFKSNYYVPFPKFQFSTYDIPTSFDRLLQNEDRAGILGTKLSLENAGYKVKRAGKFFEVEGCADACTIIGIGMSSIENAIHSYLAHLGLAHPKREKDRYQRMIIPMMMTNSVASWVTIFFGQTGGSHTVNASCASGTVAVGEAFVRVRDGLNPVAIAGGVEAMTDSDGAVMRGYDNLGALTRSKDGVPRPFSEDRSGFLFSQGGGCILVTEELNHAVKRNAPIYAEIVDYVDNSDAHNIIQMEKSGRNIEDIFRRLSAGKKVDYINAHGTGTIQSDEIEKGAICSVFGNKKDQPIINSTKGLLGHTIGASGAIEAAVTALAIRDSVVHANVSANMMEELNLAETDKELGIKNAITVSYGFGGHNSGLRLKRFEQR